MHPQQQPKPNKLKKIAIHHVMKLPELLMSWSEQADPALSHTIVEPQMYHASESTPNNFKIDWILSINLNQHLFGKSWIA